MKKINQRQINKKKQEINIILTKNLQKINKI